jgi:hypothetical protein
VDLESLDTQGLLDPKDESLDFVRKRENLRPMAIYRILNEFLLCYDGESFLFLKNELSCLIYLKSLHFMLTKEVSGRGKSSWCIGRACRQGLVSWSHTEEWPMPNEISSSPA